MLLTALFAKPCTSAYVVNCLLFESRHETPPPQVPNQIFPFLSSARQRTWLCASPCSIVYVVKCFRSLSKYEIPLSVANQNPPLRSSMMLRTVLFVKP